MNRPTRSTAALVAVGGIALVLLAACAGGDDATRRPVVVIGVDGLEWSVLGPLFEAGELPALASLAERGVLDRLSTLEPTLSPAIWTTIATGKPPEEHGITHFARPEGEGLRLLTNRDRRVKALWNVASDAGRGVCVVGWWMTFPAERVNGVMVAQTNTPSQLDVGYGRAVWKGRLVRGLPGQVFPLERQDRAMALAAEVESGLDARLEEAFGRVEPVGELGRRLWRNTLWAFRADSIYAEVTHRLLGEGDAGCELTMVYFGGPDVVGHRFWRYYRPGDFADRPTAAEIERFGDVIPAYYRWVDRRIGELLARAGDDARVVVVSDHGMHAANQRQRFDPDLPPMNVNSGDHRDAPPGVLIAAGPGIVHLPLDADPPPVVGGVLDLAPTLLALLGLEIGRDMSGEVLESVVDPAFLERHPPRYLPTHDSREWLANRPQELLDDTVEQERLEQLRALGYL